MVQKHVAGAFDRVGVDVSPATVLRGEMQERVDPTAGAPCEGRRSEVTFEDLHILGYGIEVAQTPAREIVRDGDACTMGHEQLD
jgi:hypothetical protein